MTQTFPPESQTTVQGVLGSYLYAQYSDDDDLQAFVQAFNELAQEYVDWFNQIGLPVYTGDLIAQALLDWVAGGLYGFTRPALPSGLNQDLGPLNTYTPNQVALDQLTVIGPSNYAATSDDVFKRIITWHFFKGDGKVFNIQWLKRRVMRFLIGTNGTAPNVADTSRVSVTFGTNEEVSIGIVNGASSIFTAALLNNFALNTVAPDQLTGAFTPFAAFPMAPVFQAAVEAGVLELPFQFDWVVTI
jgi:hypothetical protein